MTLRGAHSEERKSPLTSCVHSLAGGLLGRPQAQWLFDLPTPMAPPGLSHNACPLEAERYGPAPPQAVEENCPVVLRCGVPRRPGTRDSAQTADSQGDCPQLSRRPSGPACCSALDVWSACLAGSASPPRSERSAHPRT